MNDDAALIRRSGDFGLAVEYVSKLAGLAVLEIGCIVGLSKVVEEYCKQAERIMAK